MQETVRRYAEGVRREHGVALRIRVGLNSGEVVVRSIGSDLRTDYTAVPTGDNPRPNGVGDGRSKPSTSQHCVTNSDRRQGMKPHLRLLWLAFVGLGCSLSDVTASWAGPTLADAAPRALRVMQLAETTFPRLSSAERALIEASSAGGAAVCQPPKESGGANAREP